MNNKTIIGLILNSVYCGLSSESEFKYEHLQQLVNGEPCDMTEEELITLMGELNGLSSLENEDVVNETLENE